ncbi:MAG: creatininase family protein [Chloroflexi bacterium]|nr:creatininase family protein [Chloroflexota bacterium]
MDKVRYEELTPHEFRERIAAAPIAYLPLGTLEWHGEHLPLGADGLQSRGFFEGLACAVGGIVLPMLFLGIDRRQEAGDRDLYGMDICMTDRADRQYPSQQMAGSAYWVDEDTFESLLETIIRQLSRAGFRIIVGHGHGPSTRFFLERVDVWRDRYGVECFICWGSEHDAQGMGIQTDHAAANETSLVMALRPDLVRMDALPADPDVWPLGIAGKDPRVSASPELGRRIIALQQERMAAILHEALVRLTPVVSEESVGNSR